MRIITSAVQMPDSLSLYFDTHQSPLNPRNQGHTYSYGTLPLFLTRWSAEWLDNHVCGRSADALGAMAATLRDLLVELGYERATAVGQSYGGGIAMQFAYQCPERCERLVLVDSGGLGSEVNPVMRLLTLPGSEAVLLVACASPVRRIVEAIGRIALREVIDPHREPCKALVETIIVGPAVHYATDLPTGEKGVPPLQSV